MLGQLVEKACIGFVGEDVLPGMRHSSRVEICIGQAKVSSLRFGQKTLVVLECVVDAGDIEIFGFACGDLEVERLERSYLRHKPQEKTPALGFRSPDAGIPCPTRADSSPATGSSGICVR